MQFPEGTTIQDVRSAIAGLKRMTPLDEAVMQHTILKKDPLFLHDLLTMCEDVDERQARHPFVAEFRSCEIVNGGLYLLYERFDGKPNNKTALGLPFCQRLKEIWYTNQLTGITLRFDAQNPYKVKVETERKAHETPSVYSIYEACDALKNTRQEIISAVQNIRNQKLPLVKCEELGEGIKDLIAKHNLEGTFYAATIPRK